MEDIFTKVNELNKSNPKKKSDLNNFNKNETKIDKNNNNIFNFDISQPHYDKYDLEDFKNRKINRDDRYINNNISQGIYMNCYITGSNITPNFH